MIAVLFIIIVIIGIFGGLYYTNHTRLKHLTAIAPDDLLQYKGINLVDSTTNPLKCIGADTKHPVHYMGIDSSHRVLFPESAYGNQHRYYLAAVSFSPRLAKTNQPKDNVKAALNENQRPLTLNDQHTSAYLTLLKTDFTNAFKINVKAQNPDIQVLNQVFVIKSKELRQTKNAQKKHPER